MYAKTFRSTKREKTTHARNPVSHAQVTQRDLMIAGTIVGAVLLIGAMVAPLCAQSYPNKPIRFILPFAAGRGDRYSGTHHRTEACRTARPAGGA